MRSLASWFAIRQHAKPVLFGAAALALSIIAVAGTSEVDHVRVVCADDAIEMRVEQAESGRRSPMSEEPRLDVLRTQWLAQQRIRLQKNLSDREVICGGPVAIDAAERIGGERRGRLHR